MAKAHQMILINLCLAPKKTIKIAWRLAADRYRTLSTPKYHLMLNYTNKLLDIYPNQVPSARHSPRLPVHCSSLVFVRKDWRG
jgi:hypothetical protein